MAEEDSVEPGAKRKQQAASTRRLVGGVAATFANDGGVPPPKKYNQSTNSVSDSVMQSVSTRDTGSRSLGQDASLDQSYMQSSYIQSNTNTVLVGSSQIGGGTMKSYVKDHLSRMQDDVEQTTRKLELEQRRLYEIDASLACAEQEYAMKNDRYNGKKKQPDTSGDDAKKKEDPKAKTQGTATAAEAREERARRSRGGGSRTLHEVRTLEARLEKKIAELNQGKSENDQLRAQIDQLRKERQTHDHVFRKLAREIKANAKRLEDRKQLSSDTKHDAEEYEEKKASIAKKTEREREEFKAQCLTLKVKMHDQETLHKEQGKLQDSLQLRSEANANGDQAKADKPKKYVVADEEEAFSKDLLCNRILKTCFLNTIQRRHIRQYEKDVEVFQQAFATIKSTTGISDIEEIVKIFVKLEERNFSLLTYVNTLNREIESLEKHNRELEEQIREQRRLEKEGEERRHQVLAELRAQITGTIAVTDENMASFEQHAEILEKCKPYIFAISKTIEKENRGSGGQVPSETSDDNILSWLTYIERSLMQWRDFLPETKHQQNFKPFPYTIGAQVKMLPPKKPNQQPTQILRIADLPNAMLSQEGTGATRGPVRADGDSDSDEEDYGDHPWSRQELKDKTLASLAKRRKHKNRTEATAGAGEPSWSGDGPMGDGGKDGGKQLDYDDMTRTEGQHEDGEGSNDSDGSDDEDAVGPTDEEINEIFLKRYKMSKEELQQMAERLGIQLNNLCYLKQEFDAYDEDRSGYIDVKELKELLEKLGEELSEDELDQAFRELDSDGSGEIEFFEFVEWFTSED